MEVVGRSRSAPNGSRSLDPKAGCKEQKLIVELNELLGLNEFNGSSTLVVELNELNHPLKFRGTQCVLRSSFSWVMSRTS